MLSDYNFLERHSSTMVLRVHRFNLLLGLIGYDRVEYQYRTEPANTHVNPHCPVGIDRATFD